MRKIFNFTEEDVIQALKTIHNLTDEIITYDSQKVSKRQVFVKMRSKLAKKRIDLNLSLKQVAEKVGLSYSLLYYLEAGEKPFTANSLKKLSDFYQCIPDELKE